MHELQVLYGKRKITIARALDGFSQKRTPEQLFVELCFCLMTPGTDAFSVAGVMETLVETRLLWNGTEKKIASKLKGKVRFHNNKAKNIVQARTHQARLPALLREDNRHAREWLVQEVHGLGWKEASHFLRNVGCGQGLAILDRHILRNLHAQGLIDSVPAHLSTHMYMKFEQQVERLAHSLRIPMEELDLLLWSKETGKVFK